MLGSYYHIPVLLKEAIDFLKVNIGGKYIDSTLGGGGHSEEIVKRGGNLLGIDRDPEAIEFASKRLENVYNGLPLEIRKKFSPPVFYWGNFTEIDKAAEKFGFDKVDGILFDLGVSSHQLETAERGFSFNMPGVLDMRMDPRLAVTARDLINVLNEGELYDLFLKLGEEKHARSIARAVCRARRIKKIETCDELAEIIIKTVPPRGPFDRTHPATRVFQALRIAVNDELNGLKETLPKALDLLKPGGRIVVLSFHSLEDRIVKVFFREKEKEDALKIIVKSPIKPKKEEVAVNPRSRSAKLRVAEKI